MNIQRDWVKDVVPPYGNAFKIQERKYQSEIYKDNDISYFNDHFELECSYHANTVKVAAFVRNKK